MIKRLLLLTAILGFAVSCNDYEDDFANLNDQFNGVNAKLDNIQSAVDGIAGVQLELLNINSALAAISSSIADLPTVEDIAGLTALINSTSSSLAAQMSDLDSDLQAVAASIIAELDAMEDIIENGFLAVNTSLTALGANIQIIDDEISVLQTGVLDLASAVAIVDGKIVAVDNELDTLLSNLTGQLAAQLADITAQFATLTGVIDANQSEALIWYLNTMTGIGRVEVDLDAINAQNVQILQQLAGMLTVVNAGFATQSAELTAAEAAILAEITLVQQSLATTLLEIAGLESLVQSSIDGTGGVDDQLAVINALIVSLQSDLTTLLESTTTIYQGNITITNSAQLDYAVELDNKVMVINGAVEVDSNFATDAALLASLNGVMDKFKTVTGAVTITSNSDLTMSNLNSVGGSYKVTGVNITDSALASVAGDAEYNYNSDSYVEQNLVNVGGSLTISNNGAATVDFSNLATVSGFVINDGAANPAVTNTLVNTDTITLGAGITDADVTSVNGSPAVITLNITADTTDAISISTSTSIVITGDTFDVGDVTISAAVVTSTLEDITGNISVTTPGALTFAANNLGVAASGAGANAVAASRITVALTSNGSNIDLNDVVASTFTISDTGLADSDTDFLYNSIDATSFTYTSDTASAGAVNKFVTTGSATSAWTVGTTSMSSLRGVTFTLLADTDPGDTNAATHCEQGIVLTGNLSITTTGSGAGIDVDFGNMIGDLTLSAGGNMNVDSYVAAATTASIVGDSSIVSGTNSATGAANMNVNHRVIDCSTPGDTLADRTASYGVSTGNVTHIAGSVNDAGNLTYRAATNTGTYSAAAAGNMILGGGTDFTESFTVTSLKAGGTISFPAAATVAGAISVTGEGAFNGTRFSATATRTGDLAISANEGITLPEFTSLGASTAANGNAMTYFTTLATTTGALNISAVTDIAGPATISSTTGAIDARALTHIDTPITVSSTTGAIDLRAVTIVGTAAVAAVGGNNPVAAVDAIPVNTSVTSTSGDITLTALTSVISNDATLNAGTGALAAASLASHTGTAIALGGVMELQALASSTGSIALSGPKISDDDKLDVLATFVSMTSSVPTMILPLYSSGTFDITSTALTAPSIDLADLSADALETLTLTAQASDIAIGAGDYAALTTLAVTTNNTGLDSIVLDAVDALASATLVGKADVLQVMNNTALTTLNPAGLANKGDAATGSKVHIMNNDNTGFTTLETGTSRMHELKIVGNAALTTIDLTSYLTAGNAPAANDTVTAADLATVTFILDITGNAIAGTLTPVDNAGQQTTGLVSAELAAEAKLIAAHLFGFTQGTVVAQADFVGLQATANSEDQYNNDTDFSTAGGGINTAAEWALLTAN